MGPTKVLREKVLCRSLSSIHILYNQALVGGLSDSFDPAVRIAKFQENGGSTSKRTSEERPYSYYPFPLLTTPSGGYPLVPGPYNYLQLITRSTLLKLGRGGKE